MICHFQAGADNIFTPSAIELISAKVAGMSGDVRRALDLGRRVVEISEEAKSATMEGEFWILYKFNVFHLAWISDSICLQNIYQYSHSLNCICAVLSCRVEHCLCL